jgi:predicted permease
VKIVGAESGVRQPENILVGSVRLPSDKYSSPESRRGYFERLETNLKAIPEIEERSVSSTIPPRSAGLRTFELEGRPAPPEGEYSVMFVTAGSDYFRVVGRSAIFGRDFNSGDHAWGSPVAIVNESFAARFGSGEELLGKRLRVVNRGIPGEWRVVIGVVPNLMQGDPLRQSFKPLVYVPFAQERPPREAYFLARTNAPADQAATAIRTEVQKLDPDVALTNFNTLKASFAFERDFMDAEHSELGKHATVTPVFAVLALLLAAIGLYAVIAHSVSQRTKEIGVRMAIGAASKDIRRLIFREGMRPVILGVIGGLCVSLAVNRILESQLVGVSPHDPVTLSIAPATLVLIALLACRIAMRRALNVNPVEALRHD